MSGARVTSRYPRAVTLPGHLASGPRARCRGRPSWPPHLRRPPRDRFRVFADARAFRGPCRASLEPRKRNTLFSLSRLSRIFLNTCPEARPLTPPAREKFFSSLDLHVSVLENNTRVLTRFANAPASASSRLVFAQASFFRGPVARGVRAGRRRAVFTDTGHAERERKYTYTCDCKTNFLLSIERVLTLPRRRR